MSHGDCPHGGSEDLAEAYAAGRLDEAAAESFEEHYFACETCWAEVRRALELRAALAELPAEPSVTRRRGWLVAGLLAASLAAVAVLTLTPNAPWRHGAGAPGEAGTSAPRGETAWRGSGALAVTARIDGEMLRIEWEPDAGAASYVVEVTAGDGSQRSREETAATQVEIARAKLEPAAGGPWRIEVRALDALGNVVGESEAVSLPESGAR